MANQDFFVSIASGTMEAVTVPTVTTVSNLTNGSINILTGTVTLLSTVTTVTNLTSGSVRMTVGTLTTGTLQNLVSGTINALAAGTVTAGTLTNLVSGTINALASGTITAGTLTNLVSGTINALASGTITAGTLTNLVSGTINALASGTITGGTLGNLNYGTVVVDSRSAGSPVLTGHTLGTGGGTFFGTLIAPVGAGTYIYLTGFSIVGRAGGSIDVGIATNVAGTTGAGVIARGFFNTAGGGIARDLTSPLRIGTNGTLAYFLITAGTADFSYSYFVGP